MSFIADAYNRIAQNRALKTSNREGFKSNNRDVSNGSGKKTMLKFIEVSDEELEIIKLDIRKKGKIYRTKILVITLVLTVLVLFGMYKLIY